MPAHDDDHEETPLSEHLWDLLVYVPAGIVVSAVEELPKLAARGREELGMRVHSARAVGRFAVHAGRREVSKRSGGLLGGPPARTRGPFATTRTASPSTAAGGAVRDDGTGVASAASTPQPRVRSVANGHIPKVSTLSIPGFDTLSASQVVQRLDGLNREELVSVRAYETSTRGRRTILNRIDQLLDERS